MVETELFSLYAIHQHCIAAAAAMIAARSEAHTSYIVPEELENFGVFGVEKGKELKVTIELVDECKTTWTSWRK